MSPHVRVRRSELGKSEIRTTRSGHLLNSDERLAQLIQRLQRLRHEIHDAAEDVDDMELRIECVSERLESLVSEIRRSVNER
jgi:ubiquinone biosynthesis protein UbiJ